MKMSQLWWVPWVPGVRYGVYSVGVMLVQHWAVGCEEMSQSTPGHLSSILGELPAVLWWPDKTVTGLAAHRL